MADISALHSSDSNEHYTPGYIVEAARKAMGSIDLDPFSCALANTVVKASAIYSLETGLGGFSREWSGRVFCNPPGGKIGRESRQALAWSKLMKEHKLGRVEMAVFVCFNLGFLQVSQGGSGPCPLDFPICYPKSRIAYLVDHLPGPTPKQPNRKPTKKQIADFDATGLCEGDSPPGASCIVFVPRESDCGGWTDVGRFRVAYESIGKVVIPNMQEPIAA